MAATTILSFYLVAVSFAQIAYSTDFTPADTKALSFATAIISVFLIIVTLLEAARNYPGEASRLNECASRIATVYNRFQALSVTEADVQRIAYNDEYSRTLREVDVSHADIDQLRFQLRFSEDLGIGGWAYAALVLKYVILWLFEYLLYLVLVITPLIALVALIR